MTPDALIERALHQFQTGQFDGAAKACRRVLKANPRHVDALNLLGVVSFKAGDAGRAVENLQKALALDPVNPEIHKNLGFALRDLGRHKEAAESFGRALELDSQDVVAAFQLGVALAEGGDHGEAASLFAQIVTQYPDNGLAWYNHANARRHVGNFDSAATSYARAAELLPNDARVYQGWGLALYELDRWDDALDKLRRALELDPLGDRLADTLINMGHTLRYMGSFEEALAHYDRALSLSPNQVEAVIGKAGVHELNRQFDKAHDLLRPILDDARPPTSAIDLYARLASRFGEVEHAIRLLQEALLREDLRRDQEQRLNFNLATLFDAEGRYDDAFHRFTVANALYATDYDAVAERDAINDIVRVFSRDTLARMPRASVDSDLPIFVVGMPRSGTTLVEQILASHRDVAGGGELQTLKQIVRDLPELVGCDDNNEFIARHMTAAFADGAARRYLDEVADLAGDHTRLIDKMPHNFSHLWLIQILFPGAPVVHCRRDPLDTCLSCYFQDFNERHRYSRDLNDLGRHYRGYELLMAHWRETLDLRVLDVAYEDLVADTEHWARQIVAHSGLDWDPNCLEFHRNRRFVTTASRDQVREPIYTRSVARHSHYQAHLNALRNALKGSGI